MNIIAQDKENKINLHITIKKTLTFFSDIHFFFLLFLSHSCLVFAFLYLPPVLNPFLFLLGTWGVCVYMGVLSVCPLLLMTSFTHVFFLFFF